MLTKEDIDTIRRIVDSSITTAIKMKGKNDELIVSNNELRLKVANLENTIEKNRFGYVVIDKK